MPRNVALIGHSRSRSDQSFPVREESANTYGCHAHVPCQRNGSFKNAFEKTFSISNEGKSNAQITGKVNS